MNRNILRWWLWVCGTVVVLVLAGMKGFYTDLYANDITFLGFAAIALYLSTTVWVGLKIRRGDGDLDFPWFIAETLREFGLLSLFAGLIFAFKDIAHLNMASPEFAGAVFHAVLTKLYASLVGLSCSIFLRWQIKILEAGNGHATA